MEPQHMPEEPSEPFSALQGCIKEKCPSLQICMNCRKAVEESLARVAGRKLRKLKRRPECSVFRCVGFLNTIQDRALRFHLASMAWWRFSSDKDGDAPDAIRAVMNECTVHQPEFCTEYMHGVLKALSPLTPEQLVAWFGHENVFQIAAFYSGLEFDKDGKHCRKCRLYRQGCTMHGLNGADDCPLWKDEFVQGVAKAVAKAGLWRNPCKDVKEEA